MKIHHLNCATLRPLSGATRSGLGLRLLSGRLVCHCLLVETTSRLVLVDTGFGLADICRLRTLRAAWRRAPGIQAGDSIGRRLTRQAYARFVTRPRLDCEETAARQVLSLGYGCADVSDIVLTHLDSDHAGGLVDFPGARVHIMKRELDLAMAAAGAHRPSIERFRYWPYQWAHEPNWIAYEPLTDASWYGFAGVRQLRDLEAFSFIPLPGHTGGQSGVAIWLGTARAGPSWLLHAADAYFDHSEVDPVEPAPVPGLEHFERIFAFDAAARRATQKKLRKLIRGHGEQVTMFCSHDPVEFDQLSAAGNHTHTHTSQASTAAALILPARAMRARHTAAAWSRFPTLLALG